MSGAAGVLATRVTWGVLLLACPDHLLAVSHSDTPNGDNPNDRKARWVLRILGARHLAQTAIELTGPRPVVQYLGAAVDAIHALTGVGLALAVRRWRRGAAFDAAVASGFAISTALTARTTDGRTGPMRRPRWAYTDDPATPST